MADMHAPPPSPPPEVLEAFGLTDRVHPVPGGQGRAFRVGAVVLKPTEDPIEAQWPSALMDGLAQEPGFDVPAPLRAGTGAYVAHGWTATGLVEGTTGPQGRWEPLIIAARAFHRALAQMPRPDFLARRSNPWAVADRVAWAEQTIDVAPEARTVYNGLLGLRRPVEMPSQLIHGDLTGNALFAENHDPVIIDFSPYWRPTAYAEAIVAADGLLYYPGDVPAAVIGRPEEQWIQMRVRALIFRLVASAELVGIGGRIPDDELQRFTRATATVERLAGTATAHQ